MNAPVKVKRPVLRWHGGKWLLAPWIIAHMPPHRHYVEPFGGAASVLLRKARSNGEVYNDLDGDVVNLFQVLRVPAQAERLIDLVALTPFARTEFVDCSVRAQDPVEDARRLIARSFMGFGSNAHQRDRNTGFRSSSRRSGVMPARDWMNYPEALGAIVERFRGVVIENRAAIEVMLQHDSIDTLHYCDPPYVHSTRSLKNPYDMLYGGYSHEMSDEQHLEFLHVAKALTGKVMVSGYRCDLYDAELGDWHRIDCKALADGARERLESLWLNPSAYEDQHNLFSRGAA